jgi:hypothetical protein
LFQFNVTEILDVTDAESIAKLSPEERENNIHLEFDDEWNEHDIGHSSSWLSQQVIHMEGQYHNHF